MATKAAAVVTAAALRHCRRQKYCPIVHPQAQALASMFISVYFAYFVYFLCYKACQAAPPWQIVMRIPTQEVHASHHIVMLVIKQRYLP